LLRPSVKAIRTTKGPSILVDEKLAKSKFVHIVAVGNLGNFSSTLLDKRDVTAIVTGQRGGGLLITADIIHTLKQEGMAQSQGIVVVRAGKERRVAVHGSDVVEVETAGELEMNHVLQLLAASTDSCRTSIHRTTELLKAFAKSASTAVARFHTEKVNTNPAVVGELGITGYEQAKVTVASSLKHAMKAHGAQTEKTVYSVHYSDINGLSRLENYILAKDIAEFLASQSVPFQISHSTILDHDELARGFVISICPIPEHSLHAQRTPKAHTPHAVDDHVLKKVLSPTSAVMSFNDAEVRKRIEAGCDAVIKAEPIITEYDTIVGDGDCGYTLRDGAKQVLNFILGKDLSRLPETVGDLVRDLEVNMGGTSGALYCIYLTALAASLASESTVPKALNGALAQMLKYTRARVGDRTMMDALIPFVETLDGTNDVGEAIAHAKSGVDGTKKMQATLGRSTYLDDSATQGVPDPGA
ncbi:Dak phosphatase, partial [Polychaeton citri CBS 116435]